MLALVLCTLQCHMANVLLFIIRKLRQQMKQEVEDEEKRLREARDRELTELRQKSKDQLRQEETKIRCVYWIKCVSVICVHTLTWTCYIFRWRSFCAMLFLKLYKFITSFNAMWVLQTLCMLFSMEQRTLESDMAPGNIWKSLHLVILFYYVHHDGHVLTVEAYPWQKLLVHWSERFGFRFHWWVFCVPCYHQRSLCLFRLPTAATFIDTFPVLGACTVELSVHNSSLLIPQGNAVTKIKTVKVYIKSDSFGLTGFVHTFYGADR